MGNLLVLAECNLERRKQLENIVGDKMSIVYGYKDDEDIIELINNSEIIIGEPKLETLKYSKSLKLILMTWAGVDQYACYKDRFPNQVKLCNATGAFGDIISEHIVGGLLMHYLRLDDYLENQKQHKWMRLERGESLENKTVLILGMGNIGKEAARRLKAFKTYIIGFRTTKRLEDNFDEVITCDELDETLKRVDIIIGCLPGTKETNGLLSRDRLKLLNKSIVFVNVGRGNLITEDDLKYGLDNNIIDKAIIDVMYQEPLDANDNLWDKKVYITPHVSGVAMGHKLTEDRIWNIIYENLNNYLTNKPLINVINLDEGY